MSNTTIQLRKSGQTGNTPADLAHGELAINYADGKLFYKNGVGIKYIENQKTFSTVNSNNSLIIATTPTDILSLNPGANIAISSNTTTKTITIALAPIGADQQVLFNDNGNIVGNPSLTYSKSDGKLSAKLLASTQSSGDEGGQIELSTAQSNSTLNGPINIDIYQNKLRFFEATGTNRGAYIDLSAASAGVGSDLLAGGGGGTTDTVARELAQGAFTAANTAASNTVYLQAVDNVQNTNITAVNTFAGSAFNSANAGVDLATAAYAQANSASSNTVYLNEVNTLQNTNITSVNTLTQSAYNTANLKFDTTGGTITGNVTIQNNLVVEGNLTVLGNSTTISTDSLSVTDSLIFLANGNIVTDALDIGFVGHYGGPSGETHTGFFRDPVQKEWIIFEGYTQQVLSNTLINIANPTFAYANLYANVVKANLISTRATVNGLDVYSTMTSAFASANAGVTLATAAYAQANTVPTQLQTRGIRTNASYFPLFVDSNNAVLTAESVYSTGAGINFNPSTNTITASSFTGTLIGSAFGTIGSFSTYVELTGDNDYIEWGASDDVRMMYSGVANTINLQLYSDVISFKVVDNANTADRFIFYKANGDLRLVSGNVIFSDGTVQRTESLTAAQAAYTSANSGVTLSIAAFGAANTAAGNTVALQAVNTVQNTNITNVNTFAGSSFASANAGVTLATAAYSQANNASGNTVALQAVNTVQNTNITNVNTFAQAAFNEANGAVQTGFTTISANSVSITPASNADTLTITAGNNISISACTTTKTITIASTTSGTGSGGFTYNIAPPATGNTAGDRWVDSEDGTLYTYVNDGNTSQWVDFTAFAVPTIGNIGGGTANAIVYQTGVGSTSFTSVGAPGELLTAGVGGVPIWTAQTTLSIANTQITGLITNAQVASVANTKITGLITNAQVESVANTKITGLITNAQLAGPIGATITNETANSTTHYPLFSATISGTLSEVDVSSTKLTYVPSTGTLSSTVITSTSDEKLKTNISTIKNPINTIKQLRGVEYNWKDNDQKSIGVIAQEIEKVLPYLVVDSAIGKSVMYSNIIGLLIEAIKEQQNQIDELRGKLNAN